jgi:hypothetical protein
MYGKALDAKVEIPARNASWTPPGGEVDAEDIRLFEDGQIKKQLKSNEIKQASSQLETSRSGRRGRRS